MKRFSLKDTRGLLSGPAVVMAAAIVLLFVLSLTLLAPEPPVKSPYLSSSAQPDGIKALYTLLQEKDRPVAAWKRPWRELPAGGSQTLLLAAPPRPISLAEQGELLSWVGEGNELILFDDDPGEWKLFFLEESGPANHLTAIADVTAATAAERKRSGLVATPYRLADDGGESGFTPLLVDNYGVLAGRYPYQDGQITVFLTPEWLRNDTVLAEAHFEMIWPALFEYREPGAVWFDDYHHGMVAQAGILTAFPRWLNAVAFQLAIGGLLWLWWQAVRFGPAYVPRAWTVRRGDETLRAAAGWYERRRLTADALLHQERYVRSLMTRRWGVLPGASDQQVLAAAQQHVSRAELAALQTLLGDWRRIQQAGTCSKKEFLNVSRLADGLMIKLEGV